MARALAFVTTAVIALSSPAYAKAQNDPPATAQAERAQEPVEEVVVRGRRTLFSLRREMQAARENVWDIFSAINSDDDFDISCTSTPNTGSRVRSRACRPRYANDATSRAGKELARRLSACAPTDSACLEAAMMMATADAQSYLAIIPFMNRRLDEEFHRLAAEQPELAAAILDYLAKEREYEAATRSREK